ncbi:hypothetical protein SAMN05421676_10466 [Salinibacillus kushneri]|uniref:Uncharacterized protein n=1 Tax=Salinibacillus kushneri TaxID=237682 RepID=A0A1I0DKZ6_9BACI|nr:hypothetical protein SAMN05421676_10466 [Salinibacillus kushneri]
MQTVNHDDQEALAIDEKIANKFVTLNRQIMNGD